MAIPLSRRGSHGSGHDGVIYDLCAAQPSVPDEIWYREFLEPARQVQSHGAKCERQDDEELCAQFSAIHCAAIHEASISEHSWIHRNSCIGAGTKAGTGGLPI